MPDIEETDLPGVGVKHEFVSLAGARVGVITRRSGRREFLVYDDDDPDAVAASVSLTPEESTALAELFGGSRVAVRVADVQQHIEGLSIDWLSIGPDALAVGRSIGDLMVRTKSGASIVAVLRAGGAVPAPEPNFEFEASDSVVVVGTPEGIEAAADLLGAG